MQHCNQTVRTFRGQTYFIMRQNEAVRLYQLRISKRKFSAQLEEVKAPERTMILQALQNV